MTKIEIITAQTPKHFSDARDLILTYVQWLNFDLSFQNFNQEMADLPRMYNAADGGLYVAYLNHHPVGVVGLRRLTETEAEVKRMYVRDEAKGKGIGKALLLKCIDDAKKLNYRALRLDTAEFMHAAIKLYKEHGFVEIPAYRFNPHDHARYFELKLTR